MQENSVGFKIKIKKEEWEEQMLIDKIDEFLDNGKVTCNIDGGCKLFASYI